MDKLKPCPFCGHEAMISYNSNYDFQAYCTNDACFMSQIIMEDMETEEQARTAWNKRAPSVPAVPLDKLCELLAEMYHRPGSGRPSSDHSCHPYCPDEAFEELCGIDCDNHTDAERWKVFLKHWMEEQDAAD